MSNSVAGKIALGAMALVLVAVSITSYMAIARQTEAMERADQTSADLLASAIVISSAADIVKSDIANLAQTVRRLRESNSSLLAISLHDPDGKVLASNPADLSTVTDGLRLVRPIQAYGQTFGELKLVFDTEPRVKARQDMINMTIAVTAVLLIISLFGALIWAAYFARPIVRLAEAAEQVAAGHLETRVAVGRRDEIGRLADRFNGMVVNLETSRAALERTLNELSTLYSVSRIINSTSNRDEILKLNLETLATGFRFTDVAILLEIDHAWRLCALRCDGVVESRSETMPSLADFGLGEAESVTGALRVDTMKLPDTWRFASEATAFAVPLRSGSHLVGMLIASGAGAAAPDAEKILGVVASQIAPPILISLMSDREQQKLTNPFAFIYSRIEAALARSADFGVGLAVLSFRMDRNLWQVDATATEKRFDAMIGILHQRLPDADLIVRYELDRALAVIPGWSKADARAALMALDLPEVGELITSVAVAPEDGTTAHALLASVDRA